MIAGWRKTTTRTKNGEKGDIAGTTRPPKHLPWFRRQAIVSSNASSAPTCVRIQNWKLLSTTPGNHRHLNDPSSKTKFCKRSPTVAVSVWWNATSGFPTNGRLTPDPKPWLWINVATVLYYRRCFRPHRRSHARPRPTFSAIRQTLLVAGVRHAGTTDVKCHATSQMVPGTRHWADQDLRGSGIYPAPMFSGFRQRSQRQPTTRWRAPWQSHYRRYAQTTRQRKNSISTYPSRSDTSSYSTRNYPCSSSTTTFWTSMSTELTLRTATYQKAPGETTGPWSEIQFQGYHQASSESTDNDLPPRPQDWTRGPRNT